LQQAVSRDNAFAEAWAQLAAAYTVYPNWADVPNPPWQSLASAAAQLAIGLDPGNALAHAVIGSVHYEHGDFTNALTELKKASRLQPSNATFHQWIAENLVVIGQIGAADRAYLAAFERDPLAPAVTNVGIWIAGVGNDQNALAARSKYGRGLGYRSDTGIDFTLAWYRRDFAAALAHVENVVDVYGEIGLDRRTHDAVLGALIDPTRTAEAESALRAVTEGSGDIDPWTIRYCEALGLTDLALELITEFGHKRSVWHAALWEAGGRLRYDPRVVDWLSSRPIMEAWKVHGPPDGCRIIDDRLDCASR
jgi:tetratricopeptide (TPR) repeat protein